MTDSAAPEGAQETFGEKNAKHFDKVATSDWPQWVIDLQQQIVDFLVSPDFPAWAGIDTSQDSSGSSGRRMLDYACGAGLVSKALKPLYASVVGMDVSGAMLDKYRATAASLGLSEEEMVGVRGDLITGGPSPVTEPPLPEQALRDFDMVAMSMALHHVEDAAAATRALVSRLKVGGKILIVDWAPLDGSTAAQREYQEELRRDGGRKEAMVKERLAAHAARHTVGKPEGFSEAEQRMLFQEAGCKDFAWKLADRLSYVEPVDAKGQLYWALATKA